MQGAQGKQDFDVFITGFSAPCREAETVFAGKFTIRIASIPKVFFAMLAVWIFGRSAAGPGQNRGPGDPIRDFAERSQEHREAA
jgi:hypothetical protein